MTSGYHKVYDSDPEHEGDGVEAVGPPADWPRPRSRSTFRHFCSLCNVLTLGLIVSNILFAALWVRARDAPCMGPELAYSPAAREGAIRYEKKRLYRSIEADNPFTGAPRPEHDAAWNHLIEPLTIQVSAAELAPLGDKSIRLRDGSAYIVESAVYHELHCIKRVRRHLYMDYYYPNMTEDERQREGPHIDHCLEYWREAAMCRADMALSTFYWNATSTFPASRVYSDHQCVVWDRLDAWARNRMIVIGDKSELEDPSLY